MKNESYEWWENFEKELKETGKKSCPVCNEGIVRPYGKGVTKDTARNFSCDKCDFRITNN